MALKDITAKLSTLYEKTGVDWDLHIHHCLTEPTCPAVSISPERLDVARYRVDADSIEEGVERAVDLVYREVILGETVGSYAPFTNPNDKKLVELLDAWRRGEKPEF